MNFMRKCIALLCLLFPVATGAFASGSDSLDVIHYNIHIDTLSPVTDTLAAHTEVVLMPRYASTNRFTLDLLELNVDSIKVNGATATWSYDDTLLAVHSPAAYNPTDTVRLEVWYNGVPQMDASGWGGFYLNNSLYAYNLGVGFDANPHVYGRVWFPCKDNFTDKATYEFWVETIPGQMAVCNGTLMGQTTGSDGNHVWHWKLHDVISTYLASVAVSDYVAVKDTLLSIDGDTIPIAIYVRPSDSADAVGSFVNLQAVLAGFESSFGPYPFERVGFVAVPFNSGAMEHATNIAYPAATIDGTLNYQTLWGHELSHMWFGDWVTCEDAPDMWLNEGFASWCEARLTEILGGTAAYKDYVRTNHASVLRKAHIDDGGYLAVSGVGHAVTYGTTVYDKGASVTHALRKYMGDNAFFTGIQYHLNRLAWGNANSDSLRISLETSSGQSLSDFFDGWVFSPGFPHFRVDSFSVTGAGPFTVQVHVSQRQRGPAPVINSNHLPLTFLAADASMNTQMLNFSGSTGTATFTVPFSPVAVMADIEEHLTDATIDNYKTITSTGIKPYASTYFSADVQSVTDSAFLRVTHHWIAPDSLQTPMPGLNLNTVRYWTVEGNMPAGFATKGIFSYNGSAAQYLDGSWITNSEDSIVLLYRLAPGNDWQVLANVQNNPGGSPTDRIGTVTANALVPGDYAFGIYDTPSGMVAADRGIEFGLFPNPASDSFTIEFPDEEAYQVKILDMNGKVLKTIKAEAGARIREIAIEELSAGMYLVQIKGKKGRSGSKKLMVE